MTKDFFSVKEFIQITGISRSQAYKLIDIEIPTIRLGRKVLIPAWFIRKLTTEPKS